MPDVDLQVTVTEVRPDGQEEFVQQGWLRVSHRALDAARSSDLLPVQSHQEADASMLEPGEPVLARVEVFPFGHLFRAGSRLRIWVEAPTFLPQLWAFTPSPTPGPVTILHDAAHPSRLVLPRVPNDDERVVALPDCGSVIRQPCRPDPLEATATGPATPADTSEPGADAAGDARLPATGTTVPLGAAACLAASAMLARRFLRLSRRPSLVPED